MASHKILANFSFLTIGKLVGDLFTFVFFVMLSRTFGKEAIGEYSFALALTGFLAVLSDFGLYHVTIKELNRRTGSFKEYYGSVFSTRLVLAFVVFAGLLPALPVLPFSHQLKLLILILAAYQVLYQLSVGIGATFIANQEMHLVAIYDASVKAVCAVAGILLVMVGKSLVVASIALPVTVLCYLFLLYGFCARKYGWPQLTLSWRTMVAMLREARPYGFSLLIFQVYSRTDIVLITLLLGSAAAGIYNVAYRVIFFFTFIPQFAAVAILPSASRLHVTARDELQRLYNLSLNSVVLLALPAVAGLWLTAPLLIPRVFGPAFAESTPILRVLAGLLLFCFVNRILGSFLISCDLQRERTTIQWQAALFNVAGNFLLLPVLGTLGAAVMAVSSELLLAILSLARLKPVLGLPQIGFRLLIGSLGAASFCIPFTLFPLNSLTVLTATSVVFYVTVLCLSKEIRSNELALLLNLVKWKPRKALQSY